jgi:(p)ppGpp synthase/HD superfamily hydrolase
MTTNHMSPAEARAFAIQAHTGQQYGDQPYSVHLDAVAELVKPFGEQTEIIAFLHDVVEDTRVSLETVKMQFGAFIAECVGLLTDAPGATRKERKTKTYACLAQVSGPAELALIVKTADRLANVAACITDGKRSLWGMYKEEHPAFRAAVFREGLCHSLWLRLDSVLSSWNR